MRRIGFTGIVKWNSLCSEFVKDLVLEVNTARSYQKRMTLNLYQVYRLHKRFISCCTCSSGTTTACSGTATACIPTWEATGVVGSGLCGQNLYTTRLEHGRGVAPGFSCWNKKWGVSLCAAQSRTQRIYCGACSQCARNMVRWYWQSTAVFAWLASLFATTSVLLVLLLHCSV